MANGSVFQSSTAYRPSNFGSPASKYGANRSSASRGGRGGRGNVGANTAYKNFMKDRNQSKITPRPGSNLNWGGMSGMFSKRDPGRFPEEDLAYQEKLREDVWKKTTPDVTGVGFKTKWRQKPDGTWEYTAELGEEEQAIRDAAFTRQEMFLDQATAMGSGGWEQAQQSRFDQKRALYAGEDAREAAIRRARQYATGSSTTGMFSEDARVAANLNQRNMLLEEAAFKESQSLIDANLSRGRGDVTMMGDVANWANQYLDIPSADPKGNLTGVGDASTRKWDTLAAFEEEKAKSKDKFISNILEWGGNMLMPGAGTTAKSLIYG